MMRSGRIASNVILFRKQSALLLNQATIVVLQRKKVAAEREAYKLTLRTLETLEEGANPQEIAHLKVRRALLSCQLPHNSGRPCGPQPQACASAAHASSRPPPQLALKELIWLRHFERLPPMLTARFHCLQELLIAVLLQ